MALRGTLSDFGIADIFQLVGHQVKTGVLLLKNREQEVRISFVDGNVVKAATASRDKADLLGNIMIRAGVLSEAQLEAALEEQQRTMRRLGDVLIEKGIVDEATLREFTRLQTTETLYRLFLWETGTYEFTQQDTIDYDERTQRPIRADEILLEAFRMVDEWPSVREVVPSSRMTVRKVRDLPAAGEAKKKDDDEDLLAGLDDAFSAMEAGDDFDEPSSDGDLGPNDRAVYDLIEPDIEVQTLIDRSRMGEFETCKAVMHLIRGGYVVGEIDESLAVSESAVRFNPRALLEGIPAFLTRVALYAVVASAVGGVIKLHELDDSGLLSPDRTLIVRPGQVQQQLGTVQKARLTKAIEVYRLLEGTYPETLAQLVEAGLVEDEDLHRPFQTPYAYRKTTEGYALALPLR
jgi:DNA-binding transcriptional ArsR family regulator